MKRQIVEIDETLCNGCGDCVPSCAEGAIQIINGKAKLLGENLCDGLGACLGDCPRGAIKIIEREAEAYDEVAVEEHLNARKQPSEPVHSGCPGSQQMKLNVPGDTSTKEGNTSSQLQQWPVQLHLVSPQAEYFQNSDLLIAADCVPFSMGDFHQNLLEGKSLAIACPKLDNTQPYLDKLKMLFKHNDINSVTVAIMEVPCCTGLATIVKDALDSSGKNIPCEIKEISLQGEVKNTISLTPKNATKTWTV